MLRKVLVFAAIVEMGTGIVLMADPAIVAALLLGVDLAGGGMVIGRCFGIALLALGLACWPSPERALRFSPAARAMLLYNALIALYLAFLGTAGHMTGLLLWPGAALHAAVALLLALTWRDGRQSMVTGR